MRLLTTLACSLFVFLLWESPADAGKPLDVKVTLRGKKYSIPNVSTVRELQYSVEEQSGLSSEKQGRVLFGGKKLKPSDILEDVGVEDGSVINVVPSKVKTTSSVVSANKSESKKATASSANAEGGSGMVEEMLKQAGIDSNQLDELMKSMPGGGDGEMPNMQESMEMMQNMMNSPLFQQYMNDPERLEQSRQMILNNPMMKSMMAGMPGFDEILNDPVKWRETMIAAANMYKDMGSNLMNAMGGAGASGAFGMGDGMGSFGMGRSGGALDELSEDEE